MYNRPYGDRVERVEGRGSTVCTQPNSEVVGNAGGALSGASNSEGHGLTATLAPTTLNPLLQQTGLEGSASPVVSCGACTRPAAPPDPPGRRRRWGAAARRRRRLAAEHRRLGRACTGNSVMGRTTFEGHSQR